MKDQELNQIIERCKKGERAAQSALYAKYYKGMYSVCLRILNHSAEAEDAMQEAFIAAFKQLNSFKGEVTFGSWLKKIAVNRSIDLLRKRKVHYDDLSALSEQSNEEPECKYEQFSIETIKVAISKLQDNYRVALTLFLIEGYDHNEIASILNISNGSSRIIYHRAKEKLKMTLRKMEPALNEV